MMAPKLGFEYGEAAGRLSDRKALQGRRTGHFRCCQPRDLLLQVRNYCFYEGRPPKMTEEHDGLRGGKLFRRDVSGFRVWLAPDSK